MSRPSPRAAPSPSLWPRGAGSLSGWIEPSRKTRAVVRLRRDRGQEAVGQIVQEARGGCLGVGAHEAVVRVRPRAGAPVGAPEPDEDLEQQGEVAAQFLEGLFDLLGLEAEAEPAMVEGLMYVDVWGREAPDDMGILIGRHG